MLTPYADRFFVREMSGALFRVYVQGGNLSFVKVAKRDAFRDFISHLPVASAPLLERWDARARRRLMNALTADDRRDVRALLARERSNFRIAAHQVKAAFLDPQDHAIPRPHEGLLRIDARGRKVLFLFEETEEMAAAARLLHDSRGDLLVNHTVWSPQKRKFVSERALAMSLRPLAGLR